MNDASASPAELVAARIRFGRYPVGGDEHDLQRAIAEHLGGDFPDVAVEHSVGRCRFDLWVPSLAVVVEVKARSEPVRSVGRQIVRYAREQSVAGVVLVSTVRVHAKAVQGAAKPAAFVWVTGGLG